MRRPRGILAPALMAVMALGAIACRAGESPPPASPTTHTATAPRPSSVGTHPAPAAIDLLLPSMPTGSPSAAPLPPIGQRPPCGKDEDCWSSTCCPATLAEHCVHSALAQKCALVDVTCAKSDVHYDCVCIAGQCDGRLHS